MAFDPFASETKSGPFDPFADDSAPPIPSTKKQNTSLIGDIGTGLKRGALQIPGMATGLGDIAAAPLAAASGVRKPISRAADWLGEKTGFQPGKWAEDATAEYSPEMQQAIAHVDEAKGFVPSLKSMVDEPRYAANLIAESLPSTLVGGVAARGAMGMVMGAERLAATRLAAAAHVSEARARFLPEVFAHVSWEGHGSGWDRRAGSWIAGAELRLNVFRGFADRARLAAASDAARRRAVERDQAETAIRLDVRAAAMRLSSARARDAVAANVVQLATERQRIVRDRYEQGLADAVALLTAAEALVQAQEQQVRARVDVLVGSARLERAIGR